MSGLDYRSRITGIPRVAYAYLEEGYVLGRELGFEVLPVYVRDGVVSDARPFLIGSNLRAFRRMPGAHTLAALVLSLSYFVLHLIRLGAICCVVPFFVFARALLTYEFFDLSRHLLLRGFKRLYFGLKDAINRRLGRRIAVRPGDVLFMPAWWHDTPPGYYLRLREQGVRLCPLVHDILPITHSEHYESPWREQFRAWVFDVLGHSDHVYYVSHFTRSEVARVSAEAFGYTLPPATVLHHGHDFAPPSPQPPRSGPVIELLASGRPYFLVVGSIEPKKNHLRIVAEFDRVWRTRPDVRLIIVGRAGWNDAPIREALRRHPQLHARLWWLDQVEDAELRLLYQRASAVIQASEAEGFGLPVIESLSLGAPVLANDIPVFREIAGGHARYFDVLREGDLHDAVLSLLARPPRVEDFVWPTWREQARALYADLLLRSRSESPDTVRQSPLPELARAS